MIDKLFNWRWKIGGVLLFLCVIFEIHGSSIGVYVEFFGHPEFSDIIFGKYRPIRSDEWLVFTPFAFSQYFTNFSMISEIVRGTATNMFLTYGQAVWDIAMIYRPAQIAYLFLDQGSGLAFFWMSRQIVILLVSIEFARLVLQVNKKLSVLYAIMVGFSPFIQWWYSVVGVVEIFVAGQGLVLFWKLYLENAEVKTRFLYALGFLWSSGVFIFIIYPAWQVAFGYVFLIFLIAISLEKKDKLKIILKDKFFWIVGFIVMLAPILHVLYISQDMIKLQMATEYPGQRFTTGGDLLPYFQFIHSIGSILPFRDITVFLSNCEFATFYSMSPLGIIMTYFVFSQSKVIDKLSCLLIGLIVFFTIFQLIGFPHWLAKISLMSYTTEGRLQPAVDFLQLLLVFRSLKFITVFPSSFKRLVVVELIAVVSALSIYKYLPEWFSLGRALYVMIFFTVTAFLFVSPLNKIRATILAVMMFVIGITVNPISSGVDIIYKMPVGQKISEIVQTEITNGQKNSLWIVVDDIGLNDYPLMFGAPTINSVNIYPVLERWKKLDPDGKNFKIYNRYAHIKLSLQSEPTEFYYIGSDVFGLNLNPEDFQKLEVKYILSRDSELENLSAPNTKIKKIFTDYTMSIYEVEYTN